MCAPSCGGRPRPDSGACIACLAAFGYANPARRVLASVLHTRAELRPVAAEENGAEAPRRPHLEYTSDVIEVGGNLPVPARTGRVRGARRGRQTAPVGRLDAYLLYMLIALVAIIAVVTALA